MLRLRMILIAALAAGAMGGGAVAARQADGPVLGRVSAAPPVEQAALSPAGQALADQMAAGFLKAIHAEAPAWWGCGVATPVAEQPARARALAEAVLVAMREQGATWLNPWAVLAVTWSESRGDPCAIGPLSRKAARELKLIPEDRLFNRWTAADVRTLVTHPKWLRARAKVGADLGLGQQIWERYARIADPAGPLSCGKGTPCRVPTLDEALSVDGGARSLITGMAWRKAMYRAARPWQHWPGSVRDLGYDSKVMALVYRMGGKDGARPVW
jgi:hypothetical protein